MQANIRYGKLKIKDDTHIVKVPNDDLARLMYYLSCVFTVLNYNGFSKYTNYKNYEEISYSPNDFNKVLELAEKFNPIVMVNAKIFIINENLGEIENRFLEITDERLNFHACKEIIVGGIRIRVLQIMLMKSSWISRNYFIPYKRLTEFEIESCNESDYYSDNESVKSSTCLIF